MSAFKSWTLPTLEPVDLTEINTRAGIGMLKQAIAIWHAESKKAD